MKLERGTVATDWTPAPEDNDGLQEVRGTVQVVQSTLAQATGDIKSLGERITTAQSTADGNKATVQAHAKSINGLEAQYTVKVDVNGKVAGYGLATTPKNGTPESKFIVNADRFGIGATGKADVFPFVVDTQKNRVGVNGELVVNGKAIVDKLNAGDIHGDKITANTLDANRLKAGSVTAREIGANSVTADKMNVTSLSAVSSNLGSITGGSLSIGNGKFSVTENGVLTANDAVIRGRIEADSGYFNGTIKASHIEGDVFRIKTLRKDGNIWRVSFVSEGTPMMWRIDGTVLAEERHTINVRLNGKELQTYRHQFVSSIQGVWAPVGSSTFSSAVDYVKNSIYTFDWWPADINSNNTIEIEVVGGVFMEEYPVLQTAYLTSDDPVYEQMTRKKRWRKIKDEYVVTDVFDGSLTLPENIIGVRFNVETRQSSNTRYEIWVTHSSGTVELGSAGGGKVDTRFEQQFSRPILSPKLNFNSRFQRVVFRNIEILEYA